MQTSVHQQKVAQTIDKSDAKKVRKTVSPLRQLTQKLDKQVQKVEAKKSQIEKLQRSLIEDQKEMQELLTQIGSLR